MQELVRYKANDGQEVELTPSDVLAYIVSGNSMPSDKEILAFMAKCQARGLNPLAGDCYMVTYQDRVNGGTNTSVITSKDYFIRTATQQPNFDGMEAGIITFFDGQVNFRTGSFHMPQEELVGGWARVHVKNWKVPIEAQVMISEYSTGKKMWKSKPATMIRKVALVQALREAFPVAFGGIYEREEMGETGEVTPPTGEPPVYDARPVVPVVETVPDEVPVDDGRIVVESEVEDVVEQPVTPQQRAAINKLVTELAKERGVSYATAKSALYATSAMRKVGVNSESDLKTQRQGATAIGQLEIWLETSKKETQEFETEGADDAE